MQCTLSCMYTLINVLTQVRFKIQAQYNDVHTLRKSTSLYLYKLAVIIVGQRKTATSEHEQSRNIV